MTKEQVEVARDSLPINEDLVKELENIIWGDVPICPYCHAKTSSALSRESRHHCNYCNCSFSITTNTFMHNTKVELPKWLLAIFIITESKKKITARSLSSQINVTKDTALLLINKIKEAVRTRDFTLEKMVEGPSIKNLKSISYV